MLSMVMGDDKMLDSAGLHGIRLSDTSAGLHGISPSDASAGLHGTTLPDASTGDNVSMGGLDASDSSGEGRSFVRAF